MIPGITFKMIGFMELQVEGELGLQGVNFSFISPGLRFSRALRGPG